MKAEELRYYVINNLLWCVTSTLEYAREHNIHDDLISDKTWYRNATEVANIASDTASEMEEQLGCSRASLLSVEHEYDTLIFKWANELSRHSKEIGTKFSELDETIIWYEIYLYWLKNVVSAYLELVQQPPILTSPLHSQHEQQKVTFLNLIHSLTVKLNDIQTSGKKLTITTSAQVTLQKTKACNHMVSLWQESVTSIEDVLRKVCL